MSVTTKEVASTADLFRQGLMIVVEERMKAIIQY